MTNYSDFKDIITIHNFMYVCGVRCRGKKSHSWQALCNMPTDQQTVSRGVQLDNCHGVSNSSRGPNWGVVELYGLLVHLMNSCYARYSLVTRPTVTNLRSVLALYVIH